MKYIFIALLFISASAFAQKKDTVQPKILIFKGAEQINALIYALSKSNAKHDTEVVPILEFIEAQLNYQDSTQNKKR